MLFIWLKALLTSKRKFSNYVLTLMLMEGRVKFFSPHNTAEVSQEKGIAVIFQTIVVNGD